MYQPWLSVGDFNETHSLDERDHGDNDMAHRCAKFNNWIENNAMLDLGFSGPSYTWVRGLNPTIKKSARLDKALCSSIWRTTFLEGAV